VRPPFDVRRDPEFDKNATSIFGSQLEADERLRLAEWALARAPESEDFPVCAKTDDGRPIRYMKTDPASWAEAVVVLFSVDVTTTSKIVTLHDVRLASD
jgi:hypothetical protein